MSTNRVAALLRRLGPMWFVTLTAFFVGRQSQLWVDMVSQLTTSGGGDDGSQQRRTVPAAPEPPGPAERHSTLAAPLDDQYQVPNDVFYVWCGRRSFEYRHYLSVLSFIRYLQPDSVVVYYGADPPITDGQNYNTWIDEIARRYPFFGRRRAPSACVGNAFVNESFVRDVLLQGGGTYAGESVVLTRAGHELRLCNATTAVAASDYSIVMRMRTGSRLTSMLRTFNRTQESCSRILECNDVSEYNSTDEWCTLISRPLNPKDIWEMDGAPGQLLRTIAYGRPDVVRAAPDVGQVPNICHYVWMGGPMSFLFYLSVLSALNMARFDAVYIHGYAPSGAFWNLVKDDRRVKVVYRTFDFIYGNDVPKDVRHRADILRGDILHVYGGVYVDHDTVFVRPLGPEVRSYPASATLLPARSAAEVFPAMVLGGMATGKPDSRYWRAYVRSVIPLRENDFYWVGLFNNYRVYELNPTLLHVDQRLQVLCANRDDTCHPLWLPYTHNGTRIDWTSDVDAIQVPWILPLAYYSPTKLFSAPDTDMFAVIGRVILERSGMTSHFNGSATTTTTPLTGTTRHVADTYRSHTLHNS